MSDCRGVQARIFYLQRSAIEFISGLLPVAQLENNRRPIPFAILADVIGIQSGGVGGRDPTGQTISAATPQTPPAPVRLRAAFTADQCRSCPLRFAFLIIWMINCLVQRGRRGDLRVIKAGLHDRVGIGTEMIRRGRQERLVAAASPRCKITMPPSDGVGVAFSGIDSLSQTMRELLLVTGHLSLANPMFTSDQ